MKPMKQLLNLEVLEARDTPSAISIECSFVPSNAPNYADTVHVSFDAGDSHVREMTLLGSGVSPGQDTALLGGRPGTDILCQDAGLLGRPGTEMGWGGPLGGHPGQDTGLLGGTRPGTELPWGGRPGQDTGMLGGRPGTELGSLGGRPGQDTGLLGGGRPGTEIMS